MVKAVIMLQSNKYFGYNYTKMTIAENGNLHFKSFKLTGLLLFSKHTFLSAPVSAKDNIDQSK